MTPSPRICRRGLDQNGGGLSRECQGEERHAEEPPRVSPDVFKQGHDRDAP